WTLFAQRLLVRISTLGGVRKAFPLAAEHALNPDARGPFGHVIPESVLTAVERMMKENVRHLPVIEKNGTPVGIISTRDTMSITGPLLRFVFRPKRAKKAKAPAKPRKKKAPA
ncbi:MAG: CBS domain-containing protein, partial [Nitrososphaerota archaeon]|nr:CBS domain-containing protein [Nitrososphaerota archaeon]